MNALGTRHPDLGAFVSSSCIRALADFAEPATMNEDGSVRVSLIAGNVISWRLACNGPARRLDGGRSSNDLNACGSRRPDGTCPRVFDTLRSFMRG